MDSVALNAVGATAWFYASPEPTVVLDVTSTIVAVNRSASYIMGVPIDEMEGKNLSEFIDPSQKHPHNESMDKYIDRSLEVRRMTPLGSVRLSNGKDVKVHRHAVDGPGGMVFFVGVLELIS